MEKRTTQREREIKRLYDSYTAQQATTSEAEDQLDLLESTSQKACSGLPNIEELIQQPFQCGTICI